MTLRRTSTARAGDDDVPGADLVRRLAEAGGDEGAERKAVGAYLAEFSAAAREAKVDALRSGVAEARARQEKEKPPPDEWTLANGIEQRGEEVGREWRLRAKSVGAALDEFAEVDPGKDRGWLRREAAALKSPDYDPFAEVRAGAAERAPAATVPAAEAGRASAASQVVGMPPPAGDEQGRKDSEPGPYKRSLAERLVQNPEHPEAVLKQAVNEYLEEAGSRYLEKLEKALDASLRMPAAEALAAYDAAKREFRETERAVVVEAAGVKQDLEGQPERESPAREKSPAGPAEAAREPVDTGGEELESRLRDVERGREARADMEGGPRAFAAGVTYRLALQVAAARGEDALARMGERIEGSTRAQAGLRTVGADPLLVAAAADAMARKRGDGSPQVGEALEGRTAEPVRRSKTAVLAVDMLHAHRRECSEFPDRAAAKEEVWERSRRTLAAGPVAASAARVSRTWGAACSAEIAAARGGRVEKAPPEGWKPGPGLEGLALSDRARTAVAAARKTDPAALRQHDAAAGPVVAGSGRGVVRSLAGRRAEGFNRVRQLADGLPGRVMAPVSRRLVTWAARGDVTRLKRVGAVIGRSKWLSAGVVRARVDPALVAVAVSRECAASLAAGKGWTAQAGDNRRLGQLAVEVFERHDRRESGGSPGEKEARGERVGAWRDGVSSGVAKELREVHAGWDRRKSHERCEYGDRQAEADRARSGRDAEAHDDVGRVRNGEQLWAQPSVARTEGKSFSALFTRAEVADADGGRVIFKAKAGVEPKTREVFAQLLQQSGHDLAVSDEGDGRVVVEPRKKRVVVDREALKGPDAGSVLLFAAASALVSARTDGTRVDLGEGLAAAGMVASRVAREQGLDYQPPRALGELPADRVPEKAVAEGSRHARAAADLVASRLDGRDRPSPGAQSRIDEAHAAVRRATIDGAHDRVDNRELDQGRAQSAARDMPKTQTLNLPVPAVAPAR